MIPTGLLTRGTILDHALRRAGNTKGTVRTLAADALNQALFELYTQFEWPFLHAETTLSLGGAIVALPADFLQSQDDHGLTITSINGEVARTPLAEVDRQTVALQVPTEGTPTLWHADRTTSQALLWPQNTQNVIVGTLRYRQLPPPLTDDADIPVFPWASYLIQLLYVWGLEYESDPRSVQETLRADEMLRRIRQAAMPLRSQSAVIPLDPHVFGPAFNDDVGGSFDR